MRTTFTQRVYAETLKIPRGKVSTYAQIAQAIGNPGAVRAVGNALHRNPRVGEIPCHRVVRSSGAIGGYVYGKPAKRRKLAGEGVAVGPNGRLANMRSILYVHAGGGGSRNGKTESTAKEKRRAGHP